MSNKMERVRFAISETTEKLRKEIEASHAAGKIPADYSLGFTNAMIFCDWHVNGRGGDGPKFFDRTTSVGVLPKPMVLKPGNYREIMGAEEIYENLREEALLAARKVVEAHTNDASYSARLALSSALEKMDHFVEQLTQFREQPPGETI